MAIKSSPKVVLAGDELEFSRLLRRVRVAGAERLNARDVAQRCRVQEASNEADFKAALEGAIVRELASTKRGVDLWHLVKALQLRSAADGVDNDFALAVVRMIRDALPFAKQGWVLGFDAKAAWETSLIAAVYLARTSGARSPMMARIDQDARVNGVAEAVRQLRQIGCVVPIRDGAVVRDRWEPAFIRDVDRMVSQGVGGQFFAQEALAKLSQNLCSEQGYFHVVREGGTWQRDIPRPGMPTGLALNLAAKNFGSFPTRSLRALDEVSRRLDAYGRVFDVAPSNHFEVILRDERTVLPLMQELAMFDTLYQFPQFRLRDIPSGLRHLFDWVKPEQAAQAFGAPVDAVAALVGALDSKSGLEVGPIAFSPPDFVDAVPTGVAQAILRTFSHAAAVNQSFDGPLNTGAIDGWSRPFFADGSVFTILDARIAGNAFLEGAMGLMGAVDPESNRKVGPSFEGWVHAEFARRGVVARSGEYRSSIGEGQCDAIVETSDRILFFEMKRKSLTPRSRSGDVWALLRDLQHSFLDPHRQLSRHAVALLKDGEIRFKNGTTIVRGNREIERIALTLFDFGAFHSRDVAMQFLDLVSGRSVSSNVGTPEQVDGLNKVLRTLGELASQISVLENSQRPNFPCWFLGMPQLLVLLDHVNDNESLWGELKRTRHMSSGRLSWFAEQHYMRHLSDDAKKIEEAATGLGRKRTVVIR